MADFLEDNMGDVQKKLAAALRKKDTDYKAAMLNQVNLSINQGPAADGQVVYGHQLPHARRGGYCMGRCLLCFMAASLTVKGERQAAKVLLSMKPEDRITLTVELEDHVAKSAGVVPGPGLFGRVA